MVLCCPAPWPCTGFTGVLQKLWDLNPSSPYLGKFVLHGVKWFYSLYRHWSCSARFGLLLHSVILSPCRRNRSCYKQEKLGAFFISLGKWVLGCWVFFGFSVFFCFFFLPLTCSGQMSRPLKFCQGDAVMC